MGEVNRSKLEPEFNQSVKIEFSDHRITSNDGILLLREADSRLGLTCSIASKMVDTRNAWAIRYQLGDLLRERVYAMAMGLSAQDDVDRLSHDPAFRLAVWNRTGTGLRILCGVWKISSGYVEARTTSDFGCGRRP